MNGKDFKKALLNPKHVYCLISIDSEMVDLYVSRFKEAIKADRVNYGSIKPSGLLFRTKILNVLYLQKLEPELFESSSYIFIYTDSIDKRSSIYKKYKDQIIEISNDYTNFIQSHSDMTREQASKFAKMCNNDLGIIKNNLSIYNDSNMIYNKFIDYSSDIYLWVDNFIKKQPLPNINESPISVMALLATNCTNLYKVKTNNIAGMNPYIIRCMRDLESYISEEELIQIINDCFYLDSQIKKGLIDINYTLDYLILRRKTYGNSN